MRDPYWRRARLTRVIDGDTIQVTVDLGYYVYAEHRVRLLDLNTPELTDHDPAVRARARAAMAYTAAWLNEHQAHASRPDWPLAMRTEKADAFGRFLADIECDQGHSLNADLLATGNAVPFRPRESAHIAG